MADTSRITSNAKQTLILIRWISDSIVSICVEHQHSTPVWIQLVILGPCLHWPTHTFYTVQITNRSKQININGRIETIESVRAKFAIIYFVTFFAFTLYCIIILGWIRANNSISQIASLRNALKIHFAQIPTIKISNAKHTIPCHTIRIAWYRFHHKYSSNKSCVGNQNQKPFHDA